MDAVMHREVVPGHNLGDQGDHNPGTSDELRDLHGTNGDRGADVYDCVDERRTIRCLHRIQYNLYYDGNGCGVYNLHAMRGATYRNLPPDHDGKA